MPEAILVNVSTKLFCTEKRLRKCTLPSQLMGAKKIAFSHCFPETYRIFFDATDGKNGEKLFSPTATQ
jgi:hypothetical protein